MKQTITILFFLLLLTGSCSNENRVLMSQLAHIDSLMSANPQAAYDSLRKDSGVFIKDGGRSAKMKYRLLMAKGQNKLFLQMPSDSLFQEVVDYYESKGTANEKMEAHYLMGCVYRDQHEAPKAIQCYEKAVVCADTLSQDCDFVTLYGVYGQMADIYKKQYLHQEAIKAFEKYNKYAILANDSASYIQGIAYMGSEYIALGDTVKAIDLFQKSNLLCEAHGMYQEAAQTFQKLIFIHLCRAEYSSAKSLMDVYERRSGLFDKNNNIQSGYEYYYKLKGQYYVGVNQIDSAKYYYRKLEHYGFRYEAAKGLLAVYTIYQNMDSVRKYSIRSEQEMDKILKETQVEAVVQAASLYSYTNLQRKVNTEKLLRVEERYVAICVCMTFVFSLFVLVCWYKKRHRRMKAKLVEENDNYIRLLRKMEDANEELDMLRGNSDILIEKKQKEIASLKAILQEYKSRFDQLDFMDKKKAFMTSGVVQAFREMAVPKKNGRLPRVDDWKDLYMSLQQNLTVVYEKINSNKLSAQEFQVCVLTFIGMNNSEIAVLLDVSTNVVCNAKKRANQKIFNDNSASSLYENFVSYVGQVETLSE